MCPDPHRDGDGVGGRHGTCCDTLQTLRKTLKSCALCPTGTVAVTAGGSHLCVWDMLSGGRLLARLSNHQKTVTCVAVSPMAGPAAAAAPRLLAGSLDGHVKVYELDTFKVRR